MEKYINDKYALSREIGKRIKMKREDMNITQEKLSDLTGIDEKYFYQIESGKTNTSVQNLLLISQALGLTLDYLVLGENSDDKSKVISSLLHGLSESEIDKIIKMILYMKECFEKI